MVAHVTGTGTGTEEGTRGKSMFEMKFMFIAVTCTV